MASWLLYEISISQSHPILSSPVPPPSHQPILTPRSVKSRLDSESGISFTEFSYQLLQAHDFATLYKTHNCRIQLGGSDQWGNIVAGIDMIKRVRASDAREAAAANDADTTALTKNEKKALAKEQKAHAATLVAARAAQRSGIELSAEMKAALARATEEEAAAAAAKDLQSEPAFGLTIPLLTTSTGEKFGKSAGNAVWLDEARTSVYDFYQVSKREGRVRQWDSVLTF
jgi:tyrosyl-tRNA synthetase